tara:strand:- start:1860 stop:3566 length:1707 start_codon:yes stop_codon:yes gene_type:complete
MEINNKVFNFGVCLGNEDPARAGRIRAIMDLGCPQGDYTACAESTYTKILEEEGITWTSESEKELSLNTHIYWTKFDPYVTHPMLPLFINQIPKPDEALQIILLNPDNHFENKFYIGPLISSPQELDYQNYATGRKGTSKGTRVKGPKNITQSASSSKVFPSPQHIAIEGRNNNDIILAGQKNESGEVVIRAGKFTKNKKEPDFPLNNPQVTILQLTNYSTALSLEDKTIKDVEKVVDKIKYLVEYDVYGEDSPAWLETNLTGEINLYQIAPDGTEWVGNKGPTTNDLEVNTPFNPNGNPTPDKIVATLKFGNQSVSGTTSLINRFLIETGALENQSLLSPPAEEGSGGLQQSWYQKSGPLITTGDVGEPAPTNQPLDLYPFYFRPSYKLFSYSTRGEDEKKRISTDIVNKIKIKGVDSKFGSGFLVSRNEPQPEPKEIEKTISSKVEDADKRQGIINAMSNKILLYSYDSSIPGKNADNPNNVNSNVPESGQNVGIDQENLIKMNENETEPLVRGDQLVKLLGKMVDFLEKHQHGNAGTAAKNPALTKEIRYLFDKKDFLNKNIRIN